MLQERNFFLPPLVLMCLGPAPVTSNTGNSEAWGPPLFQEKRSRSEKAILGAQGAFRCVLGAALGSRSSENNSRNAKSHNDSHSRNGVSFKVPEGHHPRGTTLREALRGNLPLRGLCGGLSEGFAGVSPRVLRGSLRGSAGVRGIFRGFRGVVTLCL